MASVVYSYVIPALNESASLPELARRLATVMDQLDGPAEAIMVDDGSTDATFSVMKEIADSDSRFRALKLSRNFGHQAAITAGLDEAMGEAVIIMDADLQHPPEFSLALAAQWRKGSDVVYAVREDRRGETRVKRHAAALYYKLLNRLAQTRMPRNAGDFRLVSRPALDAFRALPERGRYLRGMFTWIGFDQRGLPYEYRERHGGKPKYTFRRSLGLGLQGITSFSDAPLRWSLYLGFFISVISMGGLIFTIVSKLAGALTVPGWMTLAIATFLLGGVQLLVLGVVGIYVGRIHEEVKARPLYLVQRRYGGQGTVDTDDGGQSVA